MNIVIDGRSPEAGVKSTATLGEVIALAAVPGRLVTRLVIDGVEPSTDEIEASLDSPVGGQIVHIETSPISELIDELTTQARDVLGEVESARSQAVEFLQAGDQVRAYSALGECVRDWRLAQEALSRLAELKGVSLDALTIDGEPVVGWFEQFAEQLKEMIAAIRAGDLVRLADVLEYEAPESIGRMRQSFDAIVFKAA